MDSAFPAIAGRRDGGQFKRLLFFLFCFCFCAARGSGVSAVAGSLTDAIVFADGTPQSQASPYTEHEAGCWWPVLAVYYDTSCTAIVAFCQAQALSLSRPYETHPTRVEWMPPPGAPPPQGPAPPPPPPPPQPPAYVSHSSVTIEEVFSDTDSDTSWHRCGPPSQTQCIGKGKGSSSGSPHH